jgi:hypothetical protein
MVGSHANGLNYYASQLGLLEEGMRLTLDLENICFIDCEGLALIKSLIDRGIRQVNAPLFVAEQIRKCAGEQAD